MAFEPYRGDFDTKYFQKTASTAFVANTFVAEGANGQIVPAVAGSTAVIGIVQRTVTSSDADYADTTRIPVLVPEGSDSEIAGDITTGTIAITDENNLIDLTDAAGADATASVTDILKIKQFISATKASFTLNKPTIV